MSISDIYLCVVLKMESNIVTDIKNKPFITESTIEIPLKEGLSVFLHESLLNKCEYLRAFNSMREKSPGTKYALKDESEKDHPIVIEWLISLYGKEKPNETLSLIVKEASKSNEINSFNEMLSEIVSRFYLLTKLQFLSHVEIVIANDMLNIYTEYLRVICNKFHSIPEDAPHKMHSENIWDNHKKHIYLVQRFLSFIGGRIHSLKFPTEYIIKLCGAILSGFYIGSFKFSILTHTTHVVCKPDLVTILNLLNVRVLYVDFPKVKPDTEIFTAVSLKKGTIVPTTSGSFDKKCEIYIDNNLIYTCEVVDEGMTILNVDLKDYLAKKWYESILYISESKRKEPDTPFDDKI
jgi:hypothetical protein